MKIKCACIVGAVMLLVACGDKDVEAIKKEVKSNLIDPDSVKFGATAFWPKGDEACIEYNAKNRMGGYSGQKIALLKMRDGIWSVDRMEVRATSCSNTGRVVEK
jgi:hypothetical protein